MPKGKPRNDVGMAQYMASSAYKAYEQYKLQYNMFMERRRQILKKKHNQEQIVRTGDRHNGPRPDNNAQRTPRRRAQHSARQPSRRAINAQELLTLDPIHFKRATEDVSVGAMGTCASCSASGCQCAHRYLCTYCGALLFPGEAKTVAKHNVGRFRTVWCGGEFCCCNGTVDLPAVKRDAAIDALWAGPTTRQLLMNYSRQFNNALALTSAKAKTAEVPGRNGWTPSIMIEGKLSHFIGPLDATTPADRMFAQLYVSDPAASNDVMVNVRFARMNLPEGISERQKERCRELLGVLTNELKRCNKYVRDIMTAGELFAQLDRDGQIQTGSLVIDHKKAPVNVDQRTYHANGQRRIFNEVKILTDEAPHKRDIIVRFRDNHVSYVSEEHRADDALHYVLLFPLGDDGWHLDLPKKPSQKKKRSRQTADEHDEHVDRPLILGGADMVFPDAVQDDDEDEEPVEHEGCDGQRRGRGKMIPPREYYAHRLQVRAREGDGVDQVRDDAITRGGRLFQEYCCGALYKTEHTRLLFQRFNQKKMRADCYQNVHSAVAHANATGEEFQAGKRIVLTSSFTGGPRDQNQRFQDAIAVVRKTRAPSLFITMTCNPKWPEIIKELGLHEQAADRPDVVARVFRLKLARLLHELLDEGIFGHVVAHLYVIEFQHRGLPHAHILIILHDSDAIKTDDIDAYVSAELPPIPDRAAYTVEAEYRAAMKRYEQLKDAVCSHMIHGPCGRENPKAPCMVDGCCKKHFPVRFCTATRKPEDVIYPEYRRRPPNAYNGASIVHKGRVIDNSWVVPYSPYLLLTYNCHINVETCVSMKGIKYLYKYCFKGPDRAMATVVPDGVAATATPREIDEISLYQDFRTMGACEGCWCTFNFPRYGRFPAVERLPCHLHNMQTCTFEDGAERDAAASGPPRTALTDWFVFLKREYEKHQAHTIVPIRGLRKMEFTATYPDFPERYTYSKKDGWKKRIKGTVIGRMYTVNPSAGESFYLRMLLTKIPANEMADETMADSDCFSLEALKYYNGTKYDTYKDACVARRLLSDDREWANTLEDAIAFRMPHSIRALFAYIVAFNEPKSASALFEQFVEPMGDDFRHRFQRSGVAFCDEDVRSCVLLDVEERVKFVGMDLERLNIRMTDDARRRASSALRNASHAAEPKEIRDELIPPDERDALAANGNARKVTLRTSQRTLADQVLESIETNSGRLFFADAMGGTGKTHTINTILRVARSRGHIVLAVASSGIAAILLDLGRTFHSRFKAERLHPAPEQTLNITAQSALAKLLRRARCIIWDEAAMGNRFHLEALHKTLCDFMDTKKDFGGKTILLAGDFRQTLPIIRFASRAQIIEAALTRSYLWSKFVKLSLSENMRIENARRTLLNSDATNEDVTMVTHLERFAEWLLQIGNGTDPTTDELSNIRLPSELCLPEGCDQNALIEWVYPDLAVNGTNLEWLSGRAILAPYNSDVDNINDTISSRFPGDEWVLPSADEVTDTKDATNINPEFLNTLSLSGLPRHDLRLKPNMVVMLLRNMSPIEGLCNGTRLLVQNVINGRLLQAVIATGTHAGNIVFIPRIKLSPDEGIFPFAWSRLQFPVRIAFAMTYVCSSSCLALRFLCHV